MTVVQDIKNRSDIVDLVSNYVTLQKAGNNFKANCPFHSERTPSFVVFPDKQTWRCFGACATGGDVLSFIMKAENEDFSEALTRLSQITGVALPTKRENNQSEKIYQINQETMDFFKNVLNSEEGASARSYIQERGINDETADTFGIGLSPSGRESLIRHLLNAGFTKEEISTSGVATTGKDGTIRDLFTQRLMFPIMNSSGRICGFGGRTLTNSNPKYLNTPKTTVFDKSSILYGLHVGRQDIKDSETAIVVEGYMDVITAHQHGYKNVVAQMGTALTEQQVSTLKSVATNFILALDPDQAGKQATLRSLESSWQAMQISFIRAGRGRTETIFNERRAPNTLRIATLPAGKDPDLLIRENPAQWEDSIKIALPLMDYLLNELPLRFDVNRDDGKLQLLESLSPFIRGERNPFVYNRHINKLSEILSTESSYIEKQVWSNTNINMNRRNIRSVASTNVQKVPDPPLTDLLEEYCIYLLITYPDLKSEGEEISETCFELSENRDILTKWIKCSTIEELKMEVPVYLGDHLETIINTDHPLLDTKERQKSLKEIMNRLNERSLKLQEQALLDRLEQVDWKNISALEDSLDQSTLINKNLKELFLDKNN